MTWKKVDMEADPRSGQFAYFRAMVNPWAGVTVSVDITDFHKALNGRPFFLSFLYAAVRAANDVPELRRRLRDGEVIEYDRCQPSYTQIQHPCVSADDSNPRLSWGKFTEENGKVMLPVSLMFNHALADGWHATQFYRNLERELAELTALFQSENQ